MRPGIKGKRILLTGAAGFIGSRLAECLTGAYEAEVHALVRRIGAAGTARLARLGGVRLFCGDVRDPAAVREAGRGCAYVIHGVTGSPGSRRMQKAEEMDGTTAVLETAAREGAERVIYFSSAAVHDPARSGEDIREDGPLNGKVLGWRKMVGEAVVSDYWRRHALPTVVLRPTCVWGPFSPTWTVSAAELLTRAIPFLPLAGKGTANAVYIDNLVDAVYLALVEPAAVGEAFLINDDEPRTWADLYGGYARFLGVPLPTAADASGGWQMLRVSAHNAGVILATALGGKGEGGGRALRQVYDHVPLARLCASLLPQGLQRRLRMFGTPGEGASGPPASPAPGAGGFLPYGFISRPMRELYGSRSRYSSDKAKRVLGWRPRVPFAEALECTCQWLEYAGFKARAAGAG